MKIILSPIASNRTTKIFVDGLILNIDGKDIDLSVIPDGGLAEPEENSPFVGPVTREKAVIKYYYESIKAVPQQSQKWEDYTFDIESGEVPCPIVWKDGLNV